MAKKPSKSKPKKAAPKPPKKTAPKKAAPKTAKKTTTKVVKPVFKTPPPAKAVPLPGMEHVRYTDLDAYCESIGEARARKNDAVADEKGYIQGAMQSMQKHNCTAYKHAGVELLLVPGDAKLRVRLLKNDEGEGADAPTQGDLGDAPKLDPEAGDVIDHDNDD